MFNTFVSQGWQCPLCKVVHSPTVLSCYCCSQIKVTASGHTNNLNNMNSVCEDCLVPHYDHFTECVICGGKIIKKNKDD